MKHRPESLRRGDVLVYDTSDLVVEGPWGTSRSIPMAWRVRYDDDGYPTTGIGDSFILPNPIGPLVVMADFKPMSKLKRFFNQDVIEFVRVRLMLHSIECLVAVRNLIKIS